MTTDAVLHTRHIVFDYLLRIIEIEKLYDTAIELTDRMLGLSIRQHNESRDSDGRQAARLNIGFLAVAKKQFNPEYRVGFNLEDIVEREISTINNYSGLKYIEIQSAPDICRKPEYYEHSLCV